MKRLLSALLAVAALAAFPARPTQQAATGRTTVDATLAERGRQVAAARYGVTPASLAVVYATAMADPRTGRQGLTLKFQDRKTGATYQVALDALGRPLARAATTAEGRLSRLGGSGALAPNLADALAPGSDDRLFGVTIWLKERAETRRGRARSLTPGTLTAAARRARRADIEATREREVAELAGPVLERLARHGQRVNRHRHAPVLSGRLTPAMIREIASWSEIDTIYLDGTNEPELYVARAAIKANKVHVQAIRGQGIQVAQIEVGGRLPASNPYLAGVTQDSQYVCPSSVSAHSTAVAGIIRSINNVNKGIAFNALLMAAGSCGGWDSELQDRSTAAADWGALALNLSWGSNTGLALNQNDRFYDDMVLNRRITVVKSAGNRGSPCAADGNVTSPGLAYNVITVGGFDDGDTNKWSDDVMDSCSSWADPTSLNGDREKPEVVAPDVDIVTTSTASPWTGAIATGTSFSSPMVTGEVALLLQRAPDLSLWPEAVKAIVMATATNNIEGASRLSEYDGAGGIAVNRADEVAQRAANGNWGGIDYQCGPGDPSGSMDVTTMALVAGKRTRVVIVWPNDTAYEDYDLQPSADLDLVVLDPDGAVVRSSISLDNTYEIVDFKPSASGTYTLRVTRSRCDLTPRYLGWAWWRMP